ncbi:DASH complex subunit Dad2-domain-containing protein [Phyllosticta citricarpa]
MDKRQTLSGPLASHLRNKSMGAPSQSASPVLLARIEEKKRELANLKDLKALSAGLADQMEQLEQKLATLSDGTEAVAAVLSNWHNVLRAITKIPQPKEEEDQEAQGDEVPLPQTLVRIPTQQAGSIIQQASSSNTGE